MSETKSSSSYTGPWYVKIVHGSVITAIRHVIEPFSETNRFFHLLCQVQERTG